MYILIRLIFNFYNKLTNKNCYFNCYKLKYQNKYNIMNRLLYFGAGIHFQPVLDFLTVKEFVFVDSQPYTEFYRPGYIYDKAFYRTNFINELSLKAKLYGFQLVEEKVLDNTFFWSTLNPKQKACYILFPRLIPKYSNPTILKFTNPQTSQTIKYYVSNPFPYFKSIELIDDIKSSDGLIICGYHPDKSVLDYWSDRKIKFIGYDSTWFGKEESEDIDSVNSNNIIQYLHTIKIEDVDKFFSEYIFVSDVIYKYILTNQYDNEDWSEWIKKENDFIKTKPKSEIFKSDTFNGFLGLLITHKNKYRNKFN